MRKKRKSTYCKAALALILAVTLIISSFSALATTQNLTEQNQKQKTTITTKHQTMASSTLRFQQDYTTDKEQQHYLKHIEEENPETVLQLKDVKEDQPFQTYPVENTDTTPSTFKTIIVDDDADDDPDNHIWNTIQEGVDDAESGDTVRVYEGTYVENVVVDKTIDLIGNGSTVTIVDGSNIPYIDAMMIVANDVTMSGFGVENAGDDALEIQGSNNLISDCTFSESLLGIYVFEASANVLDNCVCEQNELYGIWCEDAPSSEIQNCECSNNENVGIYVDGADSSMISACTATNNEYGIRIERSDDTSMDNCTTTDNIHGTFLYYSEDCILRDNQQYNNDYNFGIYGDYEEDIDMSNTADGDPIYLVSNEENLTVDETSVFGYLCYVNCDNITFKNLDLSNVMYGIQLIDTTNSLITNCTLHSIYHSAIWIDDSAFNEVNNCTIYEVPAYAGIALLEDDNLVRDCEVYNFGHFGIYASDPYDDVYNCKVHDGEMGIRVSDDDILVKDCEVWNNQDSGIFCYSRSGITLRNNTIYDNAENFGILPITLSRLLGMDIDTSNTVNGKPIYYIKSAADMIYDDSMSIGWIALVDCTNVTVRNLDFVDFYDGMMICDSEATIESCSVSKCHYGFLIWDCDNSVTLKDCTCFDNYIGTQFQKSTGNHIDGHEAYDNTFGLWIHTSSSGYTLRNCSLHDNTYNLALRGSDADDFRHDIDTSNLVDTKPVHYYVDEDNMTFDDTMDIGFLGLVCCENMIVEDLTINNNDYGVMLQDTDNSEIRGCSFSTHYLGGVYLSYGSDNNIVEDCTMNDCGYGIAFYKGTEANTITDCTVTNSGIGIRAYSDALNHLIENCEFIGNVEGVFLYDDSMYNTMRNVICSDGSYGFDFYRSPDNKIENCEAVNNIFGIDLYYKGLYNDVVDSKITDNALVGIRCYKSDYGNITGNVIKNNLYGVYAYSANEDNHIHHNDFINNGFLRMIPQAYDETNNMWDDNASEGNYWSDYTGEDADNDGIGDTPYNISGGTQDRYPLMFPFSEPFLDITEIAGGLGVSAAITNRGGAIAEGVEWSISFENGTILLPLGGEKTGTIDIPAQSNGSISTMVFGIGILRPVIITVTVTTADTINEQQATAKVLLFFVFGMT